MITDFCNLTGYYDDSRAYTQKPKDADSQTYAAILDEAVARWEKSPERWPVRNREPREPISSQKRAIIHERDGGRCRYCGAGDKQLVLDHIIPRSAFPAEHLRFADRSDNLQSACWDCNEKRSNFEGMHPKRLGVVVKCWYCVNPEYDGEDALPKPYPVEVHVFCGSCGICVVPCVEGWVL